MTALLIVAALLLCAVWAVAGAAWFAGLFCSEHGQPDDYPRAHGWQYLVGGPLVWILLVLAWRKEAAAQGEEALRRRIRR